MIRVETFEVRKDGDGMKGRKFSVEEMVMRFKK